MKLRRASLRAASRSALRPAQLEDAPARRRWPCAVARMAPTGGQGQRAQAGIVAIAAVVLMGPFY